MNDAMRYKLHILGIPILEPTNTFFDNSSVVINVTKPERDAFRVTQLKENPEKCLFGKYSYIKNDNPNHHDKQNAQSSGFIRFHLE